ncbi:DUF4402 domain-containing protein [Massilia sp. R2A-15]|uniref:DUF4402 domain-containing protein n=1 Tax=Massilia sp. R2A-15 TaxID=3064278 RepID=UPI002732449B|nr:DUF4402 domain-containing protein [Massilia sp. R2A-15]WLI88246.1 DUF4402 domain-containing protein [Massilia sp. R2A-15]
MDARPAANLACFKIALIALALIASDRTLAAVGTASASCTVLEPIAVTKSADLSFGRFAAGPGGTVTVSTSGVRTASGIVPSADAGAPSAAIFLVTGSHGATFSIRHAASAALSRTAGSESMTLTTFSDLTAANATSGTVAGGTLSAGTQSIHIGGTLNVAPNQPVGNYAGEVSVTVEYN